jgi:signal peptidase I
MTASFDTALLATHEQEAAPRSRAARIWNVIDAVVWIGAVVGAVVIAILVQVGGFQVTRVLSPSMVPTFTPGDLVVVRTVDAMDLNVGDVPMLPDPDEPQFQYVHRIISIEKAPESGEVRVVTQGDANTESDTPVTITTAKVPQVVMSVPVGGLNLAHVTWNWSLAVLGGAVMVFLALLFLPSRKKTSEE